MMPAIWHDGLMENRKAEQKTTLRLASELHKRLRILAIERGTSYTALVDLALREFLKREEGGKSRS